MQITQHFSLEEFCHSDRARNFKIDNTPPENMMSVITRTCEGLERIRHLIGDKPITILSGYRSPRVNSLVNGSRDSQHMRGEAADIIAPAYGTAKDLALLIEKNMNILGVDQLILENDRWVHVSFTIKQRHMALTFRKGEFKKGIV